MPRKPRSRHGRRQRDRILKIEQDAADARNRLGVQLNQNIFALEQERDARIRELNAGLVERERERQQEILSITERATQARSEAEQRYAVRVQEINNRLVEQYPRHPAWTPGGNRIA